MTGPLNWYRAVPFDARQPVADTTVPTLYLWGDGDRFVTRKAAELCGRYVTADFTSEVLVGVSHWIPAQEPARTAELLLSHFS